MKYIYVDESGDFGFSKKSTKTVIIVASITGSDKSLSTWIKRIKRRKLIGKKSKISELKASHQKDEFLQYFYEHANKDLKFNIYAVVIDKAKISEKYTHEEGIIYLKAIEKLIEISASEISASTIWYLDRRPVKKLDWRFIQQSIRSKVLSLSTNNKIKLEIHSVDSERVINIQFADFIAYAIFRSKEFHDNRWVDRIKSHIKKIVTIKI